MEDLKLEERLRWERARVERALGGDQGAFGELYRAYAPAVFARVLLPKLGNREAAEDALSETFRTAFERLDGFESRGVSIYHWLCRIATNKALDMHRARGATGRALANFEGLFAPLGEQPPNPGELYDARAEALGLEKSVRETLARLNERYRRAIELRFVEELSREECAEKMSVKIGTFDVLVLRALRAFRAEWEKIVKQEPTDDARG